MILSVVSPSLMWQTTPMHSYRKKHSGITFMKYYATESLYSTIRESL